MRQLIVVLALGLAALGAAGPQKIFQFEPEARPVLAEVGVAPSRHAKLALRTSNLYLLAVHGGHEQSQLGLSVSGDGGDSFEPPVPISEPGAAVSSHGENSPSVAFNGTDAYALWEQGSAEGGTELMFARSLRFGRKFEKPIRVTDKARPSSNAFSHLSVAPNGEIYAVWLDGRNPRAEAPGTSSVFLAKSTDRGATFGRNIEVASGVCPCCRPVVAFGEQGEVYVSWRHVFKGDVRDIVMATSRDGGAAFGAPVRVADDNWKISGCPHSGPSVARKGGRLYVTWFSEGVSKDAGVRVAWSDDGAKTFSRPAIVSGGVVDANHPALSISEDGRVLVVFQGRDPVKKESWGPAQAYLVEISGAGAATPPVVLPGSRKSVSYPALAAGTVGRVYVAWTEPGEKGTAVMLSRGRRANGGE